MATLEELYPEMVDRITKARESGYSNEKIMSRLREREQKALAAGYEQEEIDKRLGRKGIDPTLPGFGEALGTALKAGLHAGAQGARDLMGIPSQKVAEVTKSQAVQEYLSKDTGAQLGEQLARIPGVQSVLDAIGGAAEKFSGREPGSSQLPNPLGAPAQAEVMAAIPRLATWIPDLAMQALGRATQLEPPPVGPRGTFAQKGPVVSGIKAVTGVDPTAEDWVMKALKGYVGALSDNPLMTGYLTKVIGGQALGGVKSMAKGAKGVLKGKPSPVTSFRDPMPFTAQDVVGPNAEFYDQPAYKRTQPTPSVKRVPPEDTILGSAYPQRLLPPADQGLLQQGRPQGLLPQGGTPDFTMPGTPPPRPPQGQLPSGPAPLMLNPAPPPTNFTRTVRLGPAGNIPQLALPPAPLEAITGPLRQGPLPGLASKAVLPEVPGPPSPQQILLEEARRAVGPQMPGWQRTAEQNLLESRRPHGKPGGGGVPPGRPPPSGGAPIVQEPQARPTKAEKQTYKRAGEPNYSGKDQRISFVEKALLAIQKAKESEVPGLSADVRKMAYIDPLTRVFNQYAEAWLAPIVARRAKLFGKDVSYFAVDADKFKRLNDINKGLGDQAIERLSQALKHVRLSQKGTNGKIRPLVIRRYGDDFSLVTHTPKDLAASAMKRIQESVNEEMADWAKEKNVPPITISIVGATLKKGGRPGALLRLGDKLHNRLSEQKKAKYKEAGEVRRGHEDEAPVEPVKEVTRPKGEEPVQKPVEPAPRIEEKPVEAKAAEPVDQAQVNYEEWHLDKWLAEQFVDEGQRATAKAKIQAALKEDPSLADKGWPAIADSLDLWKPAEDVLSPEAWENIGRKAGKEGLPYEPPEKQTEAQWRAYAKGWDTGKAEAPIPTVKPMKGKAERKLAPPIDELDAFERTFARTGAASLRVGEELHSYKAVELPSGKPAIERTRAGNRETIVGMRGEQFPNLDAAKFWARDDAKTAWENAKAKAPVEPVAESPAALKAEPPVEAKAPVVEEPAVDVKSLEGRDPHDMTLREFVAFKGMKQVESDKKALDYQKRMRKGGFEGWEKDRDGKIKKLEAGLKKMEDVLRLKADFPADMKAEWRDAVKKAIKEGKYIEPEVLRNLSDVAFIDTLEEPVKPKGQAKFSPKLKAKAKEAPKGAWGSPVIEPHPYPKGTLPPHEPVTAKVMKEQKTYLLEHIRAAIKDAPDVAPEGKDAKVVIHVPGDGKFRIINSWNALQKFEKLVKAQFPETPGKPPGFGGQKRSRATGTRIAAHSRADVSSEYASEYTKRQVKEGEYFPLGAKPGRPSSMVEVGDWISNGQYLIKKTPEFKMDWEGIEKRASQSVLDGMKDMVEEIRNPKNPREAEIIGEYGEGTSANVLLKSEGDAVILDPDYVDLVQSRYPGAEPFFVGIGANKNIPIVAWKKGGETVAGIAAKEVDLAEAPSVVKDWFGKRVEGLNWLKKKLKDETGSIEFGRKTRVEKKFDKAMERMRAADKEATKKHMAKFTEKLKPETQEKIAKAVEDQGTVPPATTRKQAKEAIAEELFTEVPHSPNSHAAHAYMKSGKFQDYLDAMPDLEELKPGEVRGQPGVVDVRESGQYVHTSFLKQFISVKKGEQSHIIGEDIPKYSKQSMDISRIAELIDGGELGGQVSQKIVWQARDTTRARLLYDFQRKSTIDDLATKYKIDSNRKEVLVWEILGGQKPKAPPELYRFAEEARKILDGMLEDMNAARAKRKQELIPYRENYITWMVRDTMMNKILGQRTRPEGLIEQAGMPDFIQPNKPFNPRELPREAKYERYIKEKRVLKLLSDYTGIAGRDIFNTNIIHNNKVHAKFLKDSAGRPNAANAIMGWTSEVFAHVPHGFDKWANEIAAPVSWTLGFQRKLRRNLMRSVFPMNWSWNLVTQTNANILLLPRVGLGNAIKGMKVFTDPRIRAIVDQTYAHVMKSSQNPEVAAFKETIAKFKRLDKEPFLDRVADRMNFLTISIEKNFTDQAIAAGYFHGKQLGLKGRALLEYAGDTGARVQGMYNLEDLPGMLRSKEIKGMFPLQTFAFEAMNNLREIVGGTGPYKGLSKKIRFGRILKLEAGIIAANALSDYFTGRDSWSALTFLPFGAPLASLAGFTTENIRYGAYQPVIIQAVNDARKAVRDVWYYDDWREARKTFFRFGGVPGGVPIERAIEGWEATEKGGVYDVKGNQQFPVSPDSKLWSLMFGPHSSEGARKAREKKASTTLEILLGGKKPKHVDPITPEGMRRKMREDLRKDLR